MPKNIVVIGAGVTGLSAAVELQQAGYTSITLIAKDFPQTSGLIDPSTQINYTSPWGGAHNRWVPPPTPTDTTAARDHALALTTFNRMLALVHAHPEAGITRMKGIEYLEQPGPEYRALVGDASSGPGSAHALGLAGFRVLRRDELPDERVALGFEYDTWCVNPMVYCAFLLNRFVYRGGKVVRKELRDPKEVFAMTGLGGGGGGGGGGVDVVVNASGAGFGDDDKMFVTRGQTCLIANRIPATITRQNADGTWTFCVPRNYDGGTIIGGTKEPDNWDPTPSPQVREQLLEKFTATYPSLGKEKVTVLQDVVGRRPTRHGGARIEREDVAPGRSIVHAYGLGGRGYEMSWGVAKMVRELVDGASATAKL